MGNQACTTAQAAAATTTTTPAPPVGLSASRASRSSSHIAELIAFAKENYETNPTDSLLALVQALQLNSGKASADQAMARIRDELGKDVAEHVMDRQRRLERATQMVQSLLDDESSLLHQQGNQHILQQAMEDGSSVVCTKCNAMIPARRWQPHQEFWCEAVAEEKC